MNPTKQQEAPGATRAWPAMAGLAATAALGVMLSAAAGGDMYHPPTINEGSIRAQATITSQTTVGTNTTLCWYGMQGWYSVEMSTNGGTTWVSVGRTAASKPSEAKSFARCSAAALQSWTWAGSAEIDLIRNSANSRSRLLSKSASIRSRTG